MSWTCSVCTLINTNKIACEACYNKRTIEEKCAVCELVEGTCATCTEKNRGTKGDTHLDKAMKEGVHSDGKCTACGLGECLCPKEERSVKKAKSAEQTEAMEDAWQVYKNRPPPTAYCIVCAGQIGFCECAHKQFVKQWTAESSTVNEWTEPPAGENKGSMEEAWRQHKNGTHMAVLCGVCKTTRGTCACARKKFVERWMREHPTDPADLPKVLRSFPCVKLTVSFPCSRAKTLWTPRQRKHGENTYMATSERDPVPHAVEKGADANAPTRCLSNGGCVLTHRMLTYLTRPTRARAVNRLRGTSPRTFTYWQHRHGGSTLVPPLSTHHSVMCVADTPVYANVHVNDLLNNT